MLSSVALLACAVTAWAVYSNVSGLLSNIAKVRKSGLPYIVVRKLRPPTANSEMKPGRG